MISFVMISLIFGGLFVIYGVINTTNVMIFPFSLPEMVGFIPMGRWDDSRKNFKQIWYYGIKKLLFRKYY